VGIGHAAGVGHRPPGQGLAQRGTNSTIAPLVAHREIGYAGFTLIRQSPFSFASDQGQNLPQESPHAPGPGRCAAHRASPTHRGDFMKADDNSQAYWKATLRLLTRILIIWFVVSFGAGILFADLLNNIKLGGYPLGFWFAQQGSIYFFIILIFYYAKKMNDIDRQFDVHED
jgi:putative solute:sodium symporter small subunit